jgi:HSP20 family molecular chaperone IbpA
MDTIKKRTTVVGIATLIIGLALGLGIGIWSVRNTQASNAPAAKTDATPKTEKEEPALARDDWDPFRQMESMQEEIDRAIHRATEHFQMGPSATLFRPDLGYSSSFDLRDRKDHFEVRAYLPDAEASDVNVKIDNDRTLRVTVGHRKQEAKKSDQGQSTVTELGQYEQVITLPEPVKSAEMKVDRKSHDVVITIPKAKTT